MDNRTESILKRMQDSIETATGGCQIAIAERYCSLANREQHSVLKRHPEWTWSVAGASYALRQNAEDQWGGFRVRSEPVRL